MTSSITANLTRQTRSLSLLALALVCVVLDQWSKVYATNHLKDSPPIVLLGGIFRIEYAENHGAFLSLFANYPEEVRFWILTVINGAVLLGLAIYLLASRFMVISTFLPLALVVAGGIGNLIDRIRFGFVIDFLNLGIGNLRTGIFNIADMAITGGFILILLPLIFGEKETKADASPGAPLPTSKPGNEPNHIELTGSAPKGQTP